MFEEIIWNLVGDRQTFGERIGTGYVNSNGMNHLTGSGED